MVLSMSLGFAVATRLELVLRERAASGPSRRLRWRGLSECLAERGASETLGTIAKQWPIGGLFGCQWLNEVEDKTTWSGSFRIVQIKPSE